MRGKSKEQSGVVIINKKSKKWLLILLLVTLCIIGAFAGYKIIEKNKQSNNIAKLEKSIAVLPFKLLSNEPDKQYLADGMMDEITLHLSKIKDLRVLGRTSTEQYRNPAKSTTAIGKELEVNYLLEGSFQKFGDSVRLIVQLIKTGKEGHVWVIGNKKEAEYYSDKQVEYCLENIKKADTGAASINEFYYILAGIFAFRGEKEKAYENLRVFNQNEKGGWLLWVTLIKNDPFFDSIRNEPEFQQIVRDVEAKYQAEHERVRKWLEEKGKV